MVDLRTEKQLAEDEKIGQSIEVSDEDNGDLSDGKLETILLTVFSITIMGIFVFLLK